jgi:hypothetical protein
MLRYMLALQVFLCTFSLIHAQKFKGHRIGESVSQFIAAIPEISTLYDECKAATPKVLSDDEILQKYGKKQFPAPSKGRKLRR